MMCSSWKISVFGILALMLAFGMTSDALAQQGTVTPIVPTYTGIDDALTTIAATDLRAASEVIVTFGITTTEATSGSDQAKTSTISINIPSVWSRPRNADGDTANTTLSDGEVRTEGTGRVIGRALVATFADGAAGTVTFHFRTRLPHRMRDYTLVTSVSGPAFPNPDDITINIGPVADGAGEFDIDWTGGTLYKEPAADPDPPYENEYIIISKQSLANLVVSFTTPGTVTKGSTITLTKLDGSFNDWTHAGSGQVSVSGNVDVPDTARAADTVTATVKSRVEKGHKVAFTIKNFSPAPEVTDTTGTIESDPPTTGQILRLSTAINTTPEADNPTLTATPLPDETAPQFIFNITKPAGTGALGLNQADTTPTALTHVVTGTEVTTPATVMGTLTFTFAELAGLGKGSMYEITIPDAWPLPVLLLTGAPAESGAVSNAGKVEGRVITGNFPNGTPGVDAPNPAITYHVTKAPAPRAYEFKLRTTAGKHTQLAPAKAHTVHVTVGHGKGSLALMRGGAPLTQTTSKADLGNLMFVFTPEGYMAKDASFTITQPTAGAWTAFRVDNGDHIADEGEVTVGAKAKVDVNGPTITVTATEAWMASDRITVNYKKVTADETDTPESYTFQGQGQSFPGGGLANLTSSPTVGIGRAPDGGGTLSLNPDKADAGSSIGNLMITFAADGNMAAGSTVEVTIPESGGWPAPNDEVGRVTLSAGTLDTTATTMTATTDSDLEKGDTIVFTYGNGKLTAPAVGRTYTFSAKSTSSPEGTLMPLTAGAATITVDEEAAGSIAINSATGPLSSAAPDMALGNLAFIFTAGAPMASGSQVEVTVPVGWTPAFLDNDDGTDAPGEVSVTDAADLSVSGGGGTPWILTATTNAVLDIGNTLTITYKMVTSPSIEDRYEFTTQSSVASGGQLLDIRNQPRVTVRTPVADIGLTAEPSSVFTGEEITLTVNLLDADGEAANALDAQTVELESTSESGTFSSDMVTIADNTSSGTATYSDTMAGPATITATLGEMSATAVVTIKSTITNLQVSGMEQTDPETPVTVEAGSTITVSVIGEPGGGEVKVTQMEEDADGMVTHPTRLPTRALDTDPNQEGVPEGSVRYTRGIPLGDLADGDYTVTVTLGGEDAPIDIKVETARDPVTALTLTASADSFFAGDSIQLTVASDVRAPVGGLEVTLSTEPEDSGTFSMTEGGEATSTVTIPDAEDSMSVMVYYTNSAAGTVALTATAGETALTIAGDDISSDPLTVTVNDLVTSVQVNGMDEPDAVAGNATITVSAIGKDGAATVSVTDGEGETVVSEKGMDKDPDADVPEGSASYSRGIALPELDDGDYTVTVSIAGGSKSVGIEVMEPRDPVTALTVTVSEDSFFVGDSTQVTIASDVRTPVGGLEVTLSTDPADSGTFSMTEGGEAISTAMIPDAEDSMVVMVYYTSSTAGVVTLMATAGEISSDPVEVTVKSTISNLQVNGADGSEESPVLPVKGGSTISVTASGKDGQSGVTITDDAGESVVSGVRLDGEADDEGNVAYSRDITLPSLADGDYTVTVTIAGESASIMFTVLNDQTAPTLSSATAWPDVVANGDDVALRVKVAMNESMVAIESVTADVSKLDSTQTEPVALGVLPSEPAGTYGGFHRISADNMAADGDVMVTFTATDVLENSGTATASIRLKNDVTKPTLTMPNADPATATEGTSITISVNGGESGLTVTADASAIGGDAMESLTEGMDEDMMGTGMYSADVVVTGAADGAQSITITATDGSGNSSEAMVSVMIDNTGPALTMASADPAMAKDGTMVTISVMTEAGATVMADASAIGGDAATALAESADTAGSYSAMVTVADGTMDGDHMVSITGTDALGNEGDAASVTVTVDNTGPTLSDAAITPDWALNDDMVTISVNGGESGLTVTADASAIGGAADEALTESADTAGMYSAEVTVTGAAGGDQMVSITASDALGNMSEAASASVSIHVVTSASFSPADVSTGDTVMVSAMGTAGLTATFDVFGADGTKIVTAGSLTEDAATAGSYSGSFEVVIDVHPTGTYWVSATIGQASMTADGALTIDHLAQFTLSIGAGTHLIHVPLDVTHIDGVPRTIDTVGDLHDALGDAVNFIISLGADGSWNAYLGDGSAGGAGDAAIGDDTGLIAVMHSATSLTLAGNALGMGGASAINLAAGNNLVGVPLDPAAGLSMISDAVTMSQGAVSAVVVSNAAGNGFNTIAQAGDPGDGPIMGGVGYIVVSGVAASIPVIGMAWDNTMADDMGNGMTASAAPSIGFQTPVLQVQGKLIDEAGMVSRDGLNVTVKNVTRGTTLGSTTAADDYSMTFVKLDSSAAKVGDVLEIRADSSNPLLGVRPVQHVVTADDVLDSRIDLPDLVTYEIPAQTELLANYPNPFNPETWIPFRLAEDSNVSLSIYGASGSLVRSIDIGFTPAAVYEGRSDAIYWDGRNDFGEQVSSGIYFYHLSAGSFSATRKMVIVK